MRKRRGISACLLGVACRYDGRARPHAAALQLARDHELTPFCPEQLGGLPTPRPKSQIISSDGAAVLDGHAEVRDENGRDVTAQFLRGAQEVLRLCQQLGIDEVFLKSRSPSCGVGLIYRGEQLVPGDGVTTALLRRHDIQVHCHAD